MEFRYVAVNASGRRITGECSASSKVDVAKKLQVKHLQLISCQIKLSSLFRTSQYKLNKGILLELSRQMSILLSAGLSLSQAFEILAKEQSDLAAKRCIKHLSELVHQGQSLASALSDTSTSFDKSYCDVIAVGEKTGALGQAFEQNFVYLSARDKLNRQLKQASIYPVLVLLVSVIVITILLVKVIPGFESLFLSFDQELPFATQVVISIAKWFQSYWLLILGCNLTAICLFISCLKLQAVRFNFDKYVVKAPVVGTLLKLNFYTSFCLNGYNLLKAGIPLHHVLTKLRSGTRNMFWRIQLRTLQQAVNSGQSFHLACIQTDVFPSLLIQLIKVGEESGTLDNQLKNLAEVYQQRLDEYVKRIVSLLEPMIMIVMGVVIGGLVLVMYLPIFEMSTFL